MLKQISLAMLCIGLIACNKENQPLTQSPQSTISKSDSLHKKFSYVSGFDLIRKIRQDSTNFDLELLIQGMRDAYAEKQNPFSMEEVYKITAEVREKMIQKMRVKDSIDLARASQMDKLLPQIQDKFFEKNAQSPGVKTTASGLQYQVMKEGTGKTPQPDDLFRANFKVTYVDGTKIDDNSRQGIPAQFPADGLFKGWAEAISLCKIGGRYKFFFPPSLTYGDKGLPPRIPPKTILVFDLEIIELAGKNPMKVAPQNVPPGMMPPGAMPPPPPGAPPIRR